MERFAAVVGAARPEMAVGVVEGEPEVAILTPIGAPRIGDDPIFLIRLCVRLVLDTPANHLDG